MIKADFSFEGDDYLCSPVNTGPLIGGVNTHMKGKAVSAPNTMI